MSDVMSSPLQVWLFQTQNTPLVSGEWCTVWWAVLGSIMKQEHVHCWSLLYLFYIYLPQILNKIFVFHLFSVYNFNIKWKSCYSVYSDVFCLCSNSQNMNLSFVYGGQRAQNTMMKAQNTIPKRENMTKATSNGEGRYLLIAVAISDWMLCQWQSPRFCAFVIVFCTVYPISLRCKTDWLINKKNMWHFKSRTSDIKHLLPINVWYF